MTNDKITKEYEKELSEYMENVRSLNIIASNAGSKNLKYPEKPEKPNRYFFDAENYKKSLLNG